jgi:uncharacterized protein YdaU (DUF1376 family)
MCQFPAMMLWTDAYLADCDHLSDAEHGRYIQLLIHMWRAPDRRFPNDDQWLARKFRRSIEEVQTQLRPLLAEFFQADGNWLRHKRIEREWESVAAKAGRQKANASSRWGSADRKINAQIRSARMTEARKKGTHTRQEWEALKEVIGVCVNCGTAEYPLEKDHIIPVYQGGSDGIENIQPSCARCNARKGPENIDRRMSKNALWVAELANRVGYIPLKLREFDACQMHASTSTSTTTSTERTPTLDEETPNPDRESGVEAPAPEKAPGGASASRYRWSGGTIRLSERHYDAWLESYSHIDLKAELQSLDDYLSGQDASAKQRKDWFCFVSASLAKKNREARDRWLAAEAATQAPQQKYGRQGWDLNDPRWEQM